MFGRKEAERIIKQRDEEEAQRRRREQDNMNALLTGMIVASVFSKSDSSTSPASCDTGTSFDCGF